MQCSCRLQRGIIVNLIRVLFLLAFLPAYSQPIGDITLPEVRDLSTIFESGYILQDRNGDSVIDYVNARIVIPKNPSETHIICAANIAARLGYETSGLDLDLVDNRSSYPSSYSLPIIAIGIPLKITSSRGNKIHRNRITPSLAPGQGRIRYVEPDIYPEHGVVSIQGADDSGLIAASNFFAGRYPDLWKLKGKTLTNVRTQFGKFLEQRELPADYICLNSIDVDVLKPGVLKLSLTIRFDEQDDFKRAVKALNGKDVPDKEKKVLKVTDLEFNDVHKISIEVVAPDTFRTVLLTPKEEWNTKAGTDKSSSPSRHFSLCRLYRIDGLFKDTNEDFIPDHIPAYISVGGVENANNLVNLAARIGLESAGIKIPLVRVAGEEEKPEKYGFPILFGKNHYMIHRMQENDKLSGVSDASRAGYVQFVSKAFQDQNGLVISANSQAGLNSISDYVSKRLPYLWDYGKGHFLLENLEEDVRNFFQVRKAPGQITLALNKLEAWLKRLHGLEIDTLSVELAAEKTPKDLERFINKLVKRYFDSSTINIKMTPTGFGTGKEIFTDEFTIPWEVDDFWSHFRNEALSKITSHSRGRIRVSVSESPQVRQQIKAQIEADLRLRNVPEGFIDVVVLCAYKQGYSWLTDEVLPKIGEKKVGKIEITYHTLKDSKEIRWQTVYANTRWLQELFPIDGVLARELDIPDSLITFHPTQERDPIYMVNVFDQSGNQILEDSFSPKYVIRPFFDLFPEYESIRVTTGWVTVEIDDELLLDQRIKTDPERFWDHLQEDTYRKIVDYVMDIQEGRPSSDHAPYFDEFTVHLTLSEPNYRIGIDEEVISSVEALHEDICFETLTLFRLIGGRYGSGSMSYPGRVLPFIDSQVNGMDGKAKIIFTGKDKARPQLKMTYTERGKESVRKRYDLNVLKVPDPKLTGIWVEANKKCVSKLMFEVAATDSIDRYEEFKLRGSENTIDQTFISIGRLVDMVDILGDLHEAGIFEDELSYDKVENMLFRVALEDSLEYDKLVRLPRSQNPKKTDNSKLYDKKFKYKGQRIVQWDTPMNPDEVSENLARLNTFSEINVYYMTTSFLGHDVFAVDLSPPVEAQFISQAKLNALKPTLLLTGRVHGNEVSSTSHILRLAELCGTDTMYQNYLKNVNLVLYPVANPDGAQIAYEMQKTNPDFMLHTGRYGALGADVRSRGDDADSRYPEAGLVNRLREVWLPDVYIDLHGVPSHEWVQYFAGYSAWVRSRNVGPRSYWLPRGWYVTGFNWIEDKKYPEYMKAQKAILDSVVSAVTSQSEVDAMNRRLYRRYMKYGKQDEENYREYFYNGIQLEARLKPRKIEGKGFTNPKVTYFSATTEAADETARGDWMRLVCQAGIAHTTALLDYLANGINRIEREAKEYQDSVSRSVSRKRPILPLEKKKEQGEIDNEK